MELLQWFHEQMQPGGWLHGELAKMRPDIAQVLIDVDSGRQQPDDTVVGLLEQLRFLDERRARVSADGYPSCPACGLEYDQSLEELAEIVKGVQGTSRDNVIVVCPGCDKHYDVALAQ